MMKLPVVCYTKTYGTLRCSDHDKRSKCVHDKKYI